MQSPHNRAVITLVKSANALSLDPGPADANLAQTGEKTIFPILLAIALSHLLNDTIQSLVVALYPRFQASFALDFTQIGLINLAFQLTASLLQPFVGHFSDRRPVPYLLPLGFAVSLVGIISLSKALSFNALLVSVAFIGMGSSIFHPEASRIAYLSAGARRGLAQSLFQLGGNSGSALGPLIAVLVVTQSHILWFAPVAILGIFVLSRVSAWYRGLLKSGDAKALRSKKSTAALQNDAPVLPRKKLITAVAILVALIFSKYFYIASINNFYTFYVMEKFHLTVPQAQMQLFIFAFSVAAGTFIGGPLGDRFGRKVVIWFSILGVAPFTMLLPYANLFCTGLLTVFIGLILSSAFSAILVYAQELMPGKVGLVSGLFFGLAFGLGGIGSAALGKLADETSISYVFQVCAFLPLIGLLAGFLPTPPKRVA